MPDPAPEARSSLFDSTSRRAGQAAARTSGKRRLQILSLLRDRGPLALFEVAEIIGVFDHQISGRFTELSNEGLIRKTGSRRTKPDTGQEAEVWALAEPTTRDPSSPEILAHRLGYPAELRLADEGLFSLQPPDPDSRFPGLPYRRLPDSHPGTCIVYRIDLLECPTCGRPLRLLEEPGNPRRQFLCTTQCPTRWELLLARDPSTGLTLPILLSRTL